MTERVETEPEVVLVTLVQRDARIVPVDWDHPVGSNGYIPLNQDAIPDASTLSSESRRVVAYQTGAHGEGIPISPRYVDTPEGRGMS